MESGTAFATTPCNKNDEKQYWLIKGKMPFEEPIPAPALVVVNQKVTGKINSATTGQPLSASELEGASVNFTGTDGTVVNGAINTADGSYTAELPSGSLTGSAQANNYVTNSVSLNVSDVDLVQNFVLSKITVGKTVRFVLTWGEKPADLDIQIVNTANDEIAYYKKKKVGHMTFDTDKSTGYGPETVTLGPDATEKYHITTASRFRSSRGNLALSNAKVEVIKEGEVVQTVAIPTAQVEDSISKWDILYYDATTGQFDIVNSLS
jgi:uncharacterized protein YfaP (DUF2135 family)